MLPLRGSFIRGVFVRRYLIYNAIVQSTSYLVNTICHRKVELFEFSDLKSNSFLCYIARQESWI